MENNSFQLENEGQSKQPVPHCENKSKQPNSQAKTAQSKTTQSKTTESLIPQTDSVIKRSNRSRYRTRKGNANPSKFSRKSTNDDNEIIKSYLLEISRKSPFPKNLAFIYSYNGLERMAFYMVQSVLVLYLRYFVGFNNDDSVFIYHAFLVLGFFCSVLGAVLADSHWGRYKTIIIFGTVYFLGIQLSWFGTLPFLANDDVNGADANAASHEISKDESFKTVTAYVSLSSLIIIAMGMGGVKSTLSVFGADQFKKGHHKTQNRVDTYFMVFYVITNIATCVAFYVGPSIRNINCGRFVANIDGDDQCYFLVFLLAGILQTIGGIVFLIGTFWYTKRPPAGVNIFKETFKCVFYSFLKKVRLLNNEIEDKVEAWVIRDTYYLLRVLTIFAPLTLFWAAFEQQGSRWTLQAVNMKSQISEHQTLYPDETQILNPLFVILLTPIFRLIYFGIDAVFGKGSVTALRKISCGMVFAAFAYILAAQVQKEIDMTLTSLPTHSNEISLRVINLSENSVNGQFGSEDLESLPEPLKVSGGPGILVTSGGQTNVPDPFFECRGSGSHNFIGSQECVIAGDKGKDLMEEGRFWFDFENSGTRDLRRKYTS